MICPTCRRAMLTEQPHDHTGWPGPDPDPLTGEPVEGWETARYRAMRPVVDRGAVAWTTAAFLVLIGLVLLVLAQLSAPRPAADASPRPSLAGAPSSLRGAILPLLGAPSADGSVARETATPPTSAPSDPWWPAPVDVSMGHRALVSVSAPDTAAIGTAEQALRGVATWYAAPSRFDAAAGPLLREALGKHWRGRWVTVTANGHSILARLTDWCLCSKDRRLVDLDRRSFAILAPTSTGVVSVVVSWERGGPVPTAPATDTEEVK